MARAGRYLYAVVYLVVLYVADPSDCALFVQLQQPRLRRVPIKDGP